jgi:hypothetical protein
LDAQEKVAPAGKQSETPLVSCVNGFVQGSRKLWWRFNDRRFPGLMDAFSRDKKLVTIFNIRKDWCSMCSDRLDWGTARWSCQHEGDHREHLAHIILPHDEHVLILEFPLKTLDFNEQSLTIHAQLDNITAEITHHVSYANIPFCPSRDAILGYRYNLTACTSVQGASKFLLPEWLEYHFIQGYEHVTIFANEDPHEARQLLKPYMEKGLVEIVDWDWPVTNFMQQQAADNDCIQRYKGMAMWVAIHDVDEYMQPMEPGQTVAGFLHKNGHFKHIGALQVLSQYFGASSNPGNHALALTVKSGI